MLNCHYTGCFKKELYNGIPNVAVWRVLRKRLHLKACKRDALSGLLFNFAVRYAIRKIQEKQVGLKLNGTNQVLVYADDVNLLDITRGHWEDQDVDNIWMDLGEVEWGDMD
jgi:hypothetical protein